MVKTPFTNHLPALPTGHPVAEISGFGRSKRLRVRQGELNFSVGPWVELLMNGPHHMLVLGCPVTEVRING